MYGTSLLQFEWSTRMQWPLVNEDKYSCQPKRREIVFLAKHRDTICVCTDVLPIAKTFVEPRIKQSIFLRLSCPHQGSWWCMDRQGWTRFKHYIRSEICVQTFLTSQSRNLSFINQKPTLTKAHGLGNQDRWPSLPLSQLFHQISIKLHALFKQPQIRQWTGSAPSRMQDPACPTVLANQVRAHVCILQSGRSWDCYGNNMGKQNILGCNAIMIPQLLVVRVCVLRFRPNSFTWLIVRRHFRNVPFWGPFGWVDCGLVWHY